MKGNICKLLAVLLAFSLLAGCARTETPSSSQLPPLEDPAPAEASQDPAPDPRIIEIATADELLAAARRINQSDDGGLGETYLLTADIDLAGVEWTITGLNHRVLDPESGPEGEGFNGTFDGQGHTIRNLTIPEEQGSALLEESRGQGPGTLGMEGVAFFYCIGGQGVVKNLRLENASVALPLSKDDETGTAALLAVRCWGRVENVSVQGRVQGLYNLGGVAGTLAALNDDPGRLDHCAADVEIVGFSTLGGLAGLVRGGTLSDCTSQGSVTVVDIEGIAEEPLPQGIAGGLIGWSWEGHAVNCGTSAAVSGEASLRSMGSFCGYWEGGSVVSCWMDGTASLGWESMVVSPTRQPDPMEIEVRS